MDEFSTAELTAMQAAQVAAMQDTCTINTYSETVNSYGAVVGAWSAGTAQVCGLDMRGGKEVHGNDNTIVITDATIRLPFDTVVDMRDHITVTHRFGVAITPIVYGIVGPIRRGPSGIRLDLQKVTL